MQVSNLFVPLQSLLRETHFGELAEWSNAAVLKTVDLNGSGGSNPSLSAEKGVTGICSAFFDFSSPKVPQKPPVLSLFGGVWRFFNYFKKSETGIDSDYISKLFR